MATKKQAKAETKSDTLRTDKTFTVFLESGETVSVQAATAAEAVKKANKKD